MQLSSHPALQITLKEERSFSYTIPKPVAEKNKVNLNRGDFMNLTGVVDLKSILREVVNQSFCVSLILRIIILG